MRIPNHNVLNNKQIKIIQLGLNHYKLCWMKLNNLIIR